MIVDLSSGELQPLIKARFIPKATFHAPWKDSVKVQQGEIVSPARLHDPSNLAGLDLPEVLSREAAEPDLFPRVEPAGGGVVLSKDALMPRWRDATAITVAQINPLLLRRVANEFVPEAGVTFRYTSGLADTQLQHLMIALRAEIEEGYPAGRQFGESLAHTLAVHLVRRYSVRGDQPGGHQGGLALRRLRAVTTYIDEHLAEAISLHQLAEVAQMSQYLFGRLFKESTGLPPHQFVSDSRCS